MIDGRRRSGEPSSVHGAHRVLLGALVRRASALGAALVRRGVTADQVTVAGVLFAVATAVLIGRGFLYAGVALLIVGGLMDTLDGIVAKISGATSARGAFFDSVADRVSDAFIFGGVTWYLLERPNPRAAILPVAVLGVSSIISYTRAKAESLGFSARGGLMERAERLILLGAALVFHVVMIPLLALLLVLTCCTAIGRFVRVWNQASSPMPENRHQSGSSIRWRQRAAVAGSAAASHRLLGSADGSLVPLTVRLRSALRVQESVGPRPRRTRQRRERRARSSFRRPPTDF